MSQYTKINDTNYEIFLGKTAVESTSYTIKKGVTLIENVTQNIYFIPPIGTQWIYTYKDYVSSGEELYWRNEIDGIYNLQLHGGGGAGGNGSMYAGGGRGGSGTFFQSVQLPQGEYKIIIGEGMPNQSSHSYNSTTSISFGNIIYQIEGGGRGGSNGVGGTYSGNLAQKGADGSSSDDGGIGGSGGDMISGHKFGDGGRGGKKGSGYIPDTSYGRDGNDGGLIITFMGKSQ